jgi:hypothetical protein
MFLMSSSDLRHLPWASAYFKNTPLLQHYPTQNAFGILLVVIIVAYQAWLVSHNTFISIEIHLAIVSPLATGSCESGGHI